MNTLNENPLIKVAGSGGFIQNAATFVGQTAVDTISGFRADVFFFSCCGLSAEFGSSEAREEVAAVKRAMHRNAGKRVLLCDATKIGTDYFCRVCGLSEIDLIITDRKPEEGILAAAAGKLVWE